MTAEEREAVLEWMQAVETALGRIGHMALDLDEWQEDSEAVGTAFVSMYQARESLLKMPTGGVGDTAVHSR